MAYQQGYDPRTRDQRRNARRRRKAAYRKPQQNRVSMFLVTMAVLVIIAVIGYSAMGLQKKIDAMDARIEELQAEIQREEDRAQKLEEFRKYTQTKGYVEEVAQEQLGLVYDGEILFKQEK
ncbi:MAG: septum formation initiator family protein [Lachnospiraceae bacterium]|nr:septum formation initiator family protein [Lachnospiraceae bacterium]MBQ2100786.1 septum formation initiator family protein [Lachnospiraceae bacterium]MBQ3905607.1 septum formation initiator family protein [Lachnospiraceae bacterium]MCR4598890.1 septum formation initiator family protein [Acetatifactor sp.]